MLRNTLWFAVVAAATAFAFENDLPNLGTPTELAPKNLVLEIRHRFYGWVDDDPLGTVFGMGGGANVNAGLRYDVWSKLTPHVSYTFLNREYAVGAAYAYYFPRIVRTSLDIQFFSYRDPDFTGRQQNFFYDLAVGTEPLFGVITPSIHGAYDGYYKRMAAAFGLAAGVPLKNSILKRVALTAEYYPLFDRKENVTLPESCFVVGAELQTYGHHFVVCAANSYDIGARRLMLGGNSNRMNLGFNIYRRLEF